MTGNHEFSIILVPSFGSFWIFDVYFHFKFCILHFCFHHPSKFHCHAHPSGNPLRKRGKESSEMRQPNSGKAHFFPNLRDDNSAPVHFAFELIDPDSPALRAPMLFV
jgi:hypothetical protein